MRTRLLALVVLAACRPPVSSTEVSGTLAFEPSPLKLGDVYEGHRRPEPIDLVLSSVAGCSDVQLTPTRGFSVDEGTALALAGAERKHLTVRPPAEGLGLHEGTLTARGCELVASVALSATLVPRPTCASSSSCRTARFDLVTGACSEDALADGTACTDSCLTGATCRAGECRGQAKSCDDSDPCTLDVCSAEAGCQNVSASLLCPPPAQCASACLGPTCPMGNAQLLWSLPTHDLLGAPRAHLAADDDGNLYWLERSEPPNGAHTTALVSATPGGRERYRKSFLHIAPNHPLAPMVVGDMVLLSSDGVGNYVFAFRAGDGQLLWDARFNVLSGMGANVLTGAQRGAAVGDGSIVYALTYEAGNPTSAAVISVDLATGQLKWKHTEPQPLWHLAVDEEQNIFVDPKRANVFSLTRSGARRFSTTTDAFSALSSGRVYATAEVLNGADGKQTYPLTGNGYVWVAGAELGVRALTTSRLELFRTTDGAVRGTVDLGTAGLQDVMLTGAGGVLLISGEVGMPPVLRGVDGDGEQQFSCRLPGAGPYVGSGVLREGRYYVFEQPTFGSKGTLRAFLVAGQSLATKGWVTADATPARTRRPAAGP